MSGYICLHRSFQGGALLAALMIAISMPFEPASADGLQVSQQEIRDCLERGIRNNRSPEDIQQDLDGLNQARGGTGSVPLPFVPVQTETRDGRLVTATRPEAARYDWAKESEESLRQRERRYSERLDQLWGDLEGLRAWKDEPLLRWGRAFLAMNQASEVQGDFETKIKKIELERVAINRKPDRMIYGEAYEHYDTYDEALNAWQNRDKALELLKSQESAVRNDYIARMQALIDPNETNLKRTSLINRPDALIRIVNDSIDHYKHARTTVREWIAQNEELMRGLERRAAGEGGPPVVLPPVIQETPTEQPAPPVRARAGAARNTAGEEDAESSGANGGGGRGGAGNRDGDGDSGSDDAGDLTLGDLLRELETDEQADAASGPRTVLVDKELLAGIQAEFDAAAGEYDGCSGDFTAQLRSISGLPEKEICSNSALAAAYSCAEYAYARAANAYARAHDLLRSTEPSFDWEEMVMESELREAGRVSTMDQITIILINSNYDKIAGGVERMRAGLAAAAPGCSPDDLIRAGAQASGGSGGDGSGTGGRDGASGGGSGDGSRGGSGDGGGSRGGDGDAGYYFAKLMEPQIQSGGDIAPCGIGSLQFTRTGPPAFPDEIHPGQSYEVGQPLSWSAHFLGVQGVEVVVSVIFLEQWNMQQKEYSTYSGSGKFVHKFSANDIDFSRESGVITFSYGGRVECNEGSASTGGTVITQAYRRVAY